MRSSRTIFRQSLSAQLSLSILFFAVLIFVASIGYMFYQSRRSVQQEAFLHATQVLNKTTLRVNTILRSVETATNNSDWLVTSDVQPDSVFACSQIVMKLNPNLNGCSIAMEPFFFPQKGKYYSAYTTYRHDSLVTINEGHEEYDYFSKEWYKKAKDFDKACWVEPYVDYNPRAVNSDEMLVSYCKPLHDKTGKIIGVMANDLSLPWLSKTISTEKPYPNSYCVMLGKEGNYYVHPDSTKLVHHTIFEEARQQQNAGLESLGRKMVEGKSGMEHVYINGVSCYVFYNHLPQTEWSIGLICLESDIFRGYNRLSYIVVSIIIVGLLFMLLFCYHFVKRSVAPLNHLAHVAHHIAEGNFNEELPLRKRNDEIGKLQDSFAAMQRSLAYYIHDLHQVNEETDQRNRELALATKQVEEADSRKLAFIQDITHQIRTPLNIITGFSQILSNGYNLVGEDEMKAIITAMQENSHNIVHIVNKLIMASTLEQQVDIRCTDYVDCKSICWQATKSILLRNPETVTLKVDIPKSGALTIHTHQDYLLRVLTELLNNANRYTSEGVISIGWYRKDNDAVCFTVTDTGVGIPATESERVFDQFTKLDSFNEGLGLGLTLCRKVITLLGGTILLDTTYVGGARFVITLPINVS